MPDAAEGERLRLIGHIHRVNARFLDAADSYRQAVTLARAESLAAAEAKALVNQAQTACWAGDAALVTTVAQLAREILEVVPNPVELVKLRAAEAVTAAVASDLDAARVAVDDTRQLADEIGYRGGYNLADVATILVATRASNGERARGALADLDERTRASGGNTYWVPIAIAWLDGVGAAMAQPGIDWIDPPEETLGRCANVASP